MRGCRDCSNVEDAVSTSHPSYPVQNARTNTFYDLYKNLPRRMPKALTKRGTDRCRLIGPNKQSDITGLEVRYSYNFWYLGSKHIAQSYGGFYYNYVNNDETLAHDMEGAPDVTLFSPWMTHSHKKRCDRSAFHLHNTGVIFQVTLRSFSYDRILSESTES